MSDGIAIVFRVIALGFVSRLIRDTLYMYKSGPIDKLTMGSLTMRTCQFQFSPRSLTLAMSHLYKFGESRFGGAWLVVLMVPVLAVGASVVTALARVKLASILVSFVLVALLTSAPMPTGAVV